MKHLLGIFVSISLLVTIIGPACSHAEPRPVKKLDLRFQDAWQDAMDHHQKKRVFECMIKLHAVPTPREKEELAAAGFKARTWIKKIATGSVSARDVEAVAALPFVDVMELAVPVGMKKP